MNRIPSLDGFSVCYKDYKSITKFAVHFIEDTIHIYAKSSFIGVMCPVRD